MTRRACQRFALVPSVLLAAGLVFAEEAEAKWETIVKGSITVKNRARPESAVKEVWAQGEIAAPLQDIQATLVNPGNFKNFMPYLKGSWEIHKPEADGSVYVYTQLDFPMLTDRDYVVRVWLDEGVTADGTGAFRQHWVAVPDKIPSRANLIRVRVNDGSWDIRPLGDGRRCWAIYKFAIDPGGWVPAWAANMGNERRHPDVQGDREGGAAPRQGAAGEGGRQPAGARPFRPATSPSRPLRAYAHSGVHAAFTRRLAS